MTDQSQIIALAELDGWEYQPEGAWCKACYKRGDSVVLPEQLDYYLTSRDAIVPVIEKQSDGVQRKVAAALWSETFSRDLIGLIQSTIKKNPRQLSEALLRATGKWKE